MHLASDIQLKVQCQDDRHGRCYPLLLSSLERTLFMTTVTFSHNQHAELNLHTVGL